LKVSSGKKAANLIDRLKIMKGATNEQLKEVKIRVNGYASERDHLAEDITKKTG